MEHLEEFVIVAVVDMNANDRRSLSVKRLLHDGGDIVGFADHESRGAECLGILDIVDWSIVKDRKMMWNATVDPN